MSVVLECVAGHRHEFTRRNIWSTLCPTCLGPWSAAGVARAFVDPQEAKPK